MSTETIGRISPQPVDMATPKHRLSIVAIVCHPLFILALITAFGGLLRFSFLDRPAAWGNEAKTYQKVCGSFDEMMQTLQKQGFPPLHYEVLWLFNQKLPHSITTLRLFPALCGTLMIPAMYFLARQMVSRRVALLTALFTACSAWMIHYSRDAKMYAPLWLFVTLNVACFMWWLRTRQVTAWLAWIAAGSAMVGLQALAFVVLVIQPLWLPMARQWHWPRIPMFVIGLAIICAGPIGYYTQHNKWHGKGLDWVEQRNRGIPAIELMGDTTSAHFFNYAWIQENKSAQIPPIITKWSISILTALLVVLALGVMPWRIGRNPPTAPDTIPTEPWWRSMFWLVTWIVVPTYGFYLAAAAKPLSPASCLQSLCTILGWPWWIFAISGLGFAVALSKYQWVGRSVTIILLLVPSVLLIYAIFKGGINDRPRGIDLWLSLLRQRWFLWPASVLIPLMVWFYSAPTHRERLIRLAQFLTVCTIVIGLMCGLYAIASRFNNPLQESVWMPRYLGVLWPAVAISAAALLLRLPTRPIRWLAIIAMLGVNLVQAYAYIFISNEPPIDRIAQEVLEMRRPESHSLTYTPAASRDNGGLGGGQISGLIGRFYLLQFSGEPCGSAQFLVTDPVLHFGLKMVANPSQIVSDLDSRTDVNRVILWDRVNPAAPMDDPTLAALGPAWSRKDEIIYPVRVSWSWGWLYDYRRREYVKKPIPPR